MTVLLEGTKGFYLGSAAAVVEEGREFAWAERFVRSSPDLKWIQGNFVQANEANGNGHIFALDELRTAHTTIVHKPLNMLHREHAIQGVYVGSELLEPGGEGAGAGVTGPHVETIAAYYRYYYPDVYRDVIEPAHKEGTLFQSMECRPQSLVCRGQGEDPGCGREYAYAGRQSPTYCDHLNGPGARKVLRLPHFTAGALIVPPARPGWRRADVTELSKLDDGRESVLAQWMKHSIEEVEMAYQQIATEFPHLEPKDWEQMMAAVMSGAGIDIDQKTGKASARSVSNFPTGATWTTSTASLPDGSYFIIDADSLRAAVSQAASDGFTGADAVARKHVLRRADALGLSSLADVAGMLSQWRQKYPDWQRLDDALVAALGFGESDDYELDYEIARDFTSQRRADLAKKGLAIPVKNDKGEVIGGRFPLVTIGDLKNAVKAIGRAKGGSVAEVKAFIKKRAAALGATKMLGPAFG